MALKSDFEATNVISSTFVDEVANPGDKNAEGLENDRAEIRSLGSQRSTGDQLRGLIDPLHRGRQLDRATVLRKQIKDRKTAAKLRARRDN